MADDNHCGADLAEGCAHDVRGEELVECCLCLGCELEGEELAGRHKQGGLEGKSVDHADAGGNVDCSEAALEGEVAEARGDCCREVSEGIGELLRANSRGRTNKVVEAGLWWQGAELGVDGEHRE
jgi:hypothetical protein